MTHLSTTLTLLSVRHSTSRSHKDEYYFVFGVGLEEPDVFTGFPSCSEPALNFDEEFIIRLRDEVRCVLMFFRITDLVWFIVAPL